MLRVTFSLSSFLSSFIYENAEYINFIYKPLGHKIIEISIELKGNKVPYFIMTFRIIGIKVRNILHREMYTESSNNSSELVIH